MGFLDALWHLLNLFAPALGLAVIATVLTKLLWWRRLRAVTWVRLLGWSAVAAVAALLGGLAILGADGRIATYAAMVFATALALAWAGFGGRAHG